MGRVRSIGLALVCVCVLASNAGAAPRASVTGGVVALDGRPFFPLLTWEQCAAQADDNLALGINVFLAGRCDASALASRLAGRAYLVADYAGDAHDLAGLIGYHQPDEPDGHAVPPEALPSTQAAEARGRLVFETLTYHFSASAAPLPWTAPDWYPLYVDKAHVVGFDLYPVSYFCNNAWLGMRSVYDQQRELTALAGGRATFQWIEVNDLQGRCGRGVVTPQTIRVESWLAIAGGATALGFFTNGGPTRPLEPFSVRPDNRVAVARVTTEIDALAPVLLSPQVAAHTTAGPVCVGARRAGGRTWLLAANPTPARVDATFGVSGFGNGTASAWGDVRTVPVAAGLVSDTFEPFGVHVYELIPVPHAASAARAEPAQPRVRRRRRS